MAMRLGAPRQNQKRMITKSEKAILKTSKSTLIVVGTSSGFDLFDGNTGSHYPLTDAQTENLRRFWDSPRTHIWGDSVAHV